MLPALPSWLVYPLLFVGFFISFFFLILILKKDEKIHPTETFPDVSFVIPARNVENCITRCVESIVKQDYKGKLNIVVVNDASEDKTAHIVKTLIKKYNSKVREIILLNREKSQGKKAPVVNEGIKYVIKHLKTDFVAPVDADTFITKNVLKNAIGAFEKDELVMVVTAPLIPLQKNFLLRLQYVEYVMSNFYRELLGRVGSLCATPAFTVFKTEFFKEAGLYNEHTWTEDFDMALRVKSHFYKIAYLKDKVYFIAPEKLGKLRTERVRWGHGTFQALLKDYPYMISPKYGAVGTFFLPITVVLGLGLLMLSLLLLIYAIIYALLYTARSWSIGWRPILDFRISLFDLSIAASDPKVVLGFFSILISVLFFVFARRYGKEKISLLDYLVFFIPYIWFLAYTQLEGFIKYIFNLKMQWGHMHTDVDKKQKKHV
ncbi:MAG: glycosyltransferase family 2 protein [Candidatus Pacearchaeota archaeon]|nr:glycosyltransferase family 2 protein [Candidatus Pacearchaeota archaeon]